MITLDEIREAISQILIAKFPIITKEKIKDDYTLITLYLRGFESELSKNEFNTLRNLMLNFSANDNILLLQLIYKKYVKPKQDDKAGTI